MLDLKKLEESLDKALEAETTESLEVWFESLKKVKFHRRTKEEIAACRCSAYQYLIP